MRRPVLPVPPSTRVVFWYASISASMLRFMWKLMARAIPDRAEGTRSSPFRYTRVTCERRRDRLAPQAPSVMSR